MKPSIATAIALGLAAPAAFAASAAKDDTVTLYQVGRSGNYCLSISPNDKGCVSGSKEDGSTINVLNFIKGKLVVFENNSDAPHDMKFSGANAEDMAPQLPNGAAATKQMSIEDMLKQKISCSFHGNQLAVGYSVISRAGDGGIGPSRFQGHQNPAGEGLNLNAGNPLSAAGPLGMAAQAASGIGNIVATGLADVSGEVLAKGSQAEVANLLTARPDLMPKLQEVRPLLAQDLAAQGIASQKFIGANQIPGGLANTGLVRTGLGNIGGDASSGVTVGAALAATGLAAGWGDKSPGQAGGRPRPGTASRSGAARSPAESDGYPAVAASSSPDADAPDEEPLSGPRLKLNSGGMKWKEAGRRHRNNVAGLEDSWFGQAVDSVGWHKWIILALLTAVGFCIRVVFLGMRHRKRRTVSARGIA